MKYNKGFAPLILLAIIVGALVVGGGAVYFATKTPTSPKNIGDNNYQPQENQNQNGISNTPVVNNTSNTSAQNNQVNNIPKKETIKDTVITTATKDCLPTSTPSIKVLSPNGGEILSSAGSLPIKWSLCNIPNGGLGTSIYLERFDNGQEDLLISSPESTPKGDSYTMQTIARALVAPNSVKYKVRVEIITETFNRGTPDYVKDSSDGYFTIPN